MDVSSLQTDAHANRQLSHGILNENQNIHHRCEIK
jgi:hypothetical protein